MAGAARAFSKCACNKLFGIQSSHCKRWSTLSMNKLHSSVSTDRVTSNTVDIDGINIHYLRAGTGSKVLLLMPGALGSSRIDFPHQIDNLDRTNFSILAWDPPGYGFSRPPDREWPVDFLRNDAKIAAKFMEAVGAKTYSVLGWSDGGTTALLLALEYPECVEKLVIWGAGSFVTPADMEVNEGIRNIDDWSAKMKEPYLELYSDHYFRKMCSDWVDAYNSYVKVNNGDVCKTDIEKIECPTLILHGQKDVLVPQDHADHIHAKIRNSKLINIPEGKHNLHKRFHQMFNDVVQRFLLDPDLVESKI